MVSATSKGYIHSTSERRRSRCLDLYGGWGARDGGGCGQGTSLGLGARDGWGCKLGGKGRVKWVGAEEMVGSSGWGWGWDLDGMCSSLRKDMGRSEKLFYGLSSVLSYPSPI